MITYSLGGLGGKTTTENVWYFRALRQSEAKFMVELLNICFIEILIWLWLTS